MPTAFEWSAVGEFLGRTDELTELERWWTEPSREPLALYGRRRVGKSWLLRKFAVGKPAVLLIGRQTGTKFQLAEFAAQLEPLLGLTPAIDDLAGLVRVLFRAGRNQQLLVVIDEFPYLLPSTAAATKRELTAVAAVMEEERERSQLKLVLCGSLIGQMESLLAERAPLRGRLQPMQLHPMPFSEASLFMPNLTPIERFERFGIAGGMPRYLSALAAPGGLTGVLAERVLSPNAALWDEPRTVLEQELREPKTYFAILQQLSTGDKDTAEIADGIREDTKHISKYVAVLETMRIIERRLPIGVTEARHGRWHLVEPFFRFWFRFVFPFQDDLAAGLPARRVVTAEVTPVLNDHIASTFESQCRRWLRETYEVTKVGMWWGRSLDSLRRTGARSSEEIDVIGMNRGTVTVLGEARWRNRAISASYLAEIEDFKLPALRQSGLTVQQHPTIMLFSRGGFDTRLKDIAATRSDVVLVSANEMLTSTVE